MVASPLLCCALRVTRIVPDGAYLSAGVLSRIIKRISRLPKALRQDFRSPWLHGRRAEAFGLAVVGPREPSGSDPRTSMMTKDKRDDPRTSVMITLIGISATIAGA